MQGDDHPGDFITEMATRHLSLTSDIWQSPTDVEGLIAALGVRLKLMNVDDPHFTGVKVTAPDGWALILINVRHPEPQRRWTMAHELGHVVLDHPDPTTNLQEQAANLYAANILMPAGRLRRQIRTHGMLAAQMLAQQNLVPECQVVRRLKALGYDTQVTERPPLFAPSSKGA